MQDAGHASDGLRIFELRSALRVTQAGIEPGSSDSLISKGKLTYQTCSFYFILSGVTFLQHAFPYLLLLAYD